MPITNLGTSIAKNYLINGGADFAQRIGTAAAVPISTSPVYYNDRWAAYYGGSWSTVPTTGSSAYGTAPLTPDLLSYNYFNTYGTPSASNAELDFDQKIESFMSIELVNQLASVGFWVYGEVSNSKVQVVMATPTAQDNYSSAPIFYTSVQKDVIAGTWTYISFEGISVPASAANGLLVRLKVSNFATLNVAFTGLFHTEIMLNKGGKALPFQRAGGSYQAEFILCQRYFEKSYDVNQAVGVVAGGITFDVWAPGTNNSSGDPMYGHHFRVGKRVVPTMTLYASDGTINKMNNFYGGADYPGGATCNSQFFNPWITHTIPNSYGTYQYNWTADAEIN